MTDDIVTRLRGMATESLFGVSMAPFEYHIAADEIERLRADRECITAAYWNIRKAIECAEGMLPSPHPLWSELNELIETLVWMENLLDIPNRWEFVGGNGNTGLIHKLKVIIQFVRTCIPMHENAHLSCTTVQERDSKWQ